MKQAISFIVNVASAIYFLFSGKVMWPVVIVMALFSIMGGVLGGHLSDRIMEPRRLPLINAQLYDRIYGIGEYRAQHLPGYVIESPLTVEIDWE